jgi:DNA-binding ferritin-like protein (Dps family)
MSDVEKGGFISKVIGPKRRWREYKARVRRLPPNYRTAVDAIERYLVHFVPADGDSAASMFEDLADLFEQAAADGTPIREIVGENPVEFVEAFVQNYTEGGYVPARARKRLTDAITRAEEDRNVSTDT